MKDYIYRIFKKEHEDLSLSDIEDFFETPQEETSVLEFKSGGVAIEDIYKEVTAFLNTEGGLLIVGTPKETRETVNKTNIVRCQVQLVYSSFRNKDWLYQKIASNVTPTPTHIKIKEFLTEKGSVFLIDVPQSITPPHQCSSDGRYYIRMETEAKPAPHGLVQALFDKRRRPQLTATIEVQPQDLITDYVVVSFRNESVIPADKVGYIVDVFNIHTINSKWSFEKANDYSGVKFTFAHNIGQVLVRIIRIPISFEVQHHRRSYLVFAGFWSKDTDFDFIYWVYDPVAKQITHEGTFDSEPTLTEVLDTIHRQQTQEPPFSKD
jgi:hypothetical protein